MADRGQAISRFQPVLRPKLTTGTIRWHGCTPAQQMVHTRTRRRRSEAGVFA